MNRSLVKYGFDAATGGLYGSLLGGSLAALLGGITQGTRAARRKKQISQLSPEEMLFLHSLNAPNQALRMVIQTGGDPRALKLLSQELKNVYSPSPVLSGLGGGLLTGILGAGIGGLGGSAAGAISSLIKGASIEKTALSGAAVGGLVGLGMGGINSLEHLVRSHLYQKAVEQGKATPGQEQWLEEYKKHKLLQHGAPLAALPALGAGVGFGLDKFLRGSSKPEQPAGEASQPSLAAEIAEEVNEEVYPPPLKNVVNKAKEVGIQAGMEAASLGAKTKQDRETLVGAIKETIKKIAPEQQSSEAERVGEQLAEKGLGKRIVEAVRSPEAQEAVQAAKNIAQEAIAAGKNVLQSEQAQELVSAGKELGEKGLEKGKQVVEGLFSALRNKFSSPSPYFLRNPRYAPSMLNKYAFWGETLPHLTSNVGKVVGGLLGAGTGLMAGKGSMRRAREIYMDPTAPAFMRREALRTLQHPLWHFGTRALLGGLVGGSMGHFGGGEIGNVIAKNRMIGAVNTLEKLLEKYHATKETPVDPLVALIAHRAQTFGRQLDIEELFGQAFKGLENPTLRGVTMAEDVGHEMAKKNDLRKLIFEIEHGPERGRGTVQKAFYYHPHDPTKAFYAESELENLPNIPKARLTAKQKAEAAAAKEQAATEQTAKEQASNPGQFNGGQPKLSAPRVNVEGSSLSSFFFKPSPLPIINSIITGGVGGYYTYKDATDDRISKKLEYAIEHLKGRNVGDAQSVFDKAKIKRLETELKLQKFLEKNPGRAAALGTLAGATLGWSSGKFYELVSLGKRGQVNVQSGTKKLSSPQLVKEALNRRALSTFRRGVQELPLEDYAQMAQTASSVLPMSILDEEQAQQTNKKKPGIFNRIKDTAKGFVGFMGKHPLLTAAGAAALAAGGTHLYHSLGQNVEKLKQLGMLMGFDPEKENIHEFIKNLGPEAITRFRQLAAELEPHQYSILGEALNRPVLEQLATEKHFNTKKRVEVNYLSSLIGKTIKNIQAHGREFNPALFEEMVRRRPEVLKQVLSDQEKYEQFTELLQKLQKGGEEAAK